MSGVGAPIKSSKSTLVLDEERGSKTSFIVNWDILKPIMELCNEQCTLKVKSHKSPSKDLRATWCKNGQMSHRGRLGIVSYLDAFNEIIWSFIGQWHRLEGQEMHKNHSL